MDFLTGHEKVVAKRVLEQESQKRNHIVIALSGAHAYGFPSPDSDLDLKAIHIEPTNKLLGLQPDKEAFDRMEIIDDVEIDYTSNELRGVLKGIAAGNGNYLERILGALICQSSPLHRELKTVVLSALSQRVYRHYRGFAANQRKSLEETTQPTAKKLLYVLRTALTGTHLLRTGEMVVDLSVTSDLYGYSDAKELILTKKQGEQTILTETQRAKWSTRIDSVFALLEAAKETSPLPEEPNISDLETWLIKTRQKNFSV